METAGRPGGRSFSQREFGMVGAGAVLLAAGGGPDDPDPWGYSGDSGPENWGELSDDYAACSEGREQSPVDIATGSAASGGGELSFMHGREHVHAANTGLFVKVKYHEGCSSLRLGDGEYSLVEIHAHTPSEHTLDGGGFPMEMHMVHQGPTGELAVAGVLFQLGRVNPAVQQFINAVPVRAGDEIRSDQPLDLSGLLPSARSHYSYPGSLTTPPCTEGVRWLVMSEIQEATREQIDRISALTGSRANNRPVQPLGARTVTFRG